jgi:hypothetical protein
MIGRIVVVTLAAVLSSFPVGTAHSFTGLELQQLCSAKDGSNERFACAMYLAGYIGGINAGDGSKIKDKKAWCFPEHSTVSQGRQVVVKFMRDHPEMLHQDADWIVGLALVDAFPCP